MFDDDVTPLTVFSILATNENFNTDLKLKTLASSHVVMYKKKKGLSESLIDDNNIIYSGMASVASSPNDNFDNNAKTIERDKLKDSIEMNVEKVLREDFVGFITLMCGIVKAFQETENIVDKALIANLAFNCDLSHYDEIKAALDNDEIIIDSNVRRMRMSQKTGTFFKEKEEVKFGDVKPTNVNGSEANWRRYDPRKGKSPVWN
jgi:hypothetical protein